MKLVKIVVSLPYHFQIIYFKKKIFKEATNFNTIEGEKQLKLLRKQFNLNYDSNVKEFKIINQNYMLVIIKMQHVMIIQ